MESIEELSDEAKFRKFIKRHSTMAVLMVVVIAAAAIAAVLVFLRVAADAQTIGLVPVTLGQWSVAVVFAFLLTVLFWELAFVGSWSIPILLLIFGIWYKRLPEEERKEYGLSPKRGADPRRTEGGGFISFLIGVVWLIIVWTTNRWSLAFQAWPLNDWIYTWLTACLWVLGIVGIPLTVFIIWWLLSEKKEEA